MPIFCRKNVHSLKNTMLSCPYFVEKTSIPIINCNFDPKSCHKFSTPPRSDFFLKNRKKRASYQLFWPIIQCRFDTIDVFFDQTWALQEGVFHDFVFKWQENTVILKEYSIVLTELTFFLPNMGMTEGGFSWKIWKKLHESIVFLREWRFFWQNLAMKAVVFF